MEDGIEQPSNFLQAAALGCFVGALLLRWIFKAHFQKLPEQFFCLTTLAGVIVGGGAAYFCLSHHFCMAGHFKHPPYRFFNYINDFLWMLSFIWSAVLVFSIGINFRYACVFVGAIAIVFWGTTVNLDLIFLLPVWLLCLAFALACWFNWIE